MKKQADHKFLQRTEIKSGSLEETKAAGGAFAEQIIQKIKSAQGIPKEAVILALSGDLGSGKTTFLQGFTEKLGVERVVSPTFILMRVYNLDAQITGFEKFYHLDLYRLEGQVAAQVTDLGFDEIIKDPKAIIAVEWAEKAEDMFPDDTTWILFEYIDEKTRMLRIK